MTGDSNEDSLATETKEREAISNCFNLQSTLKLLASHAPEHLIKDVNSAQASFNGIVDFLKGVTNPVLYNEVRRSDSRVANKVFHIPELCEMILMQASFFDILNMSDLP